MHDFLGNPADANRVRKLVLLASKPAKFVQP